jgi:predicted transcriptional regulator
VVDGAGNVRGLVELARLQMLLLDELGWANAHDVMEPFASVEPGTPLTEVNERLGSCGLVQLPVVEQGSVVGLVGESSRAPTPARSTATMRGCGDAMTSEIGREAANAD